MVRLRIGVVFTVLAVTGCTGSGRAPVDLPTRLAEGDDWQKVAPASVGLDAAALERLADAAEKGASDCLVVVRDGKLAGEWYFRGTRPEVSQETFSVTKSVTSLLVGIAQYEERLSIDNPAATWIAEWRDGPSMRVTTRDLLSNASGRHWSTASDYQMLLAARDRTRYAVGLKQDRPPGQVWAYNNAAIQTIERILREATHQGVDAFARERLFGPLGMRNTRLTTDRAGNAQMFMGLQSTCRDLARLGQLMLNGGRWGGRKILTPEWVKESTGQPSTKLNDAYGQLWWLNRRGRLAGPFAESKQGAIAPEAPERLFWAIGFGQQLIQVDPGTRTVVVRLGPGRSSRAATFGPADAAGVLKAVVR